MPGQVGLPVGCGRLVVMCGITGLFGQATTSSDALRASVTMMAGELAHRGPDDDGSWVDAEAGIAFGHRRLAVIDPTPAGAQPMVSASGRTVLVFNGCIYNFTELRRQLGSLLPWRGHSDTEVLVEAIEAWGPQRAAERAEGMFAFAAWDRPTRTLSLGRDRLGEKPLYWGIIAGRVAFASDLAAIRRVPGFRPDLDPLAVGSLLRWSFIAHPRTIYRGVEQLAPGTLVHAHLDGDRVATTSTTWWSMNDVAEQATRTRAGQATRDAGRQADRHTSAEAAERIDQLLTESVTSRLVADVPTGAFLSGGIDSSLIAAIAQRQLGSTRLQTFTVAMPEIGFDESASAAAVAAHLGTQHTQLQLSTADALAVVPQLAAIYSEPFADPSMLPSVALCAAVGRQVTVALSGDGGDEAFAGYNRHVFGPRYSRRARRLPSWVRRGIGGTMAAVPPRLVDTATRSAGTLIKPLRGQRNVGDKLHKVAGLLAAGDRSTWDVLAATWPDDVLGGGEHSPSPTAGLAVMDDPLDAMLLADTAVVLPDEMLVKLDRASMAVGLEVRTPLLDYRIVEYAWTLPRQQLIDGRTGKAVLRRVLGEHVPAALFERPKMGFDPPLGAWLRGPLRPWAEDLLSEQRLRGDGWIDADAVRRTWRQHLAGRVNAEYRLWAVLMLNSWLDAQTPAGHERVQGSSR
jgi:asparagine synthase (glutamine-hydrolysing)